MEQRMKREREACVNESSLTHGEEQTFLFATDKLPGGGKVLPFLLLSHGRAAGPSRSGRQQMARGWLAFILKSLFSQERELLSPGSGSIWLQASKESDNCRTGKRNC